MENKNTAHRSIYRRCFGIVWDGELYDIHHINQCHNDNSIDNLILLPKDLHRRLHGTLKRARLDWCESIFDYVTDAYNKGTRGNYLQSLEWFFLYSQIVKELAFWGYMRENNYRNRLTGKMFDLDGIKEYGEL